MPATPRTALAAALALTASCAPPLEAAEAPWRALIVSGANNHDWQWTTPRLSERLEASGKFRVEATFDPATDLAEDGFLERFDVLVLDYNGPRWGAAAERAFLAALDRGTGVAVIHAANNAFPGWVEFETMVGHLWREGTGHGRFHAFDVTIDDRDHPITRGMEDLAAHPDELYHRLVHMHDAEKRVLATALSSTESGGTGAREPMLTVGTYRGARVFHTPLGHVWKGQPATHASYEDDRFADLVVRGVEWAASGDVTTQPAPPNALSAAERADGWRLLFDGESLAGFGAFGGGPPPEGWRVEDGQIVVRGGGAGGDLVTTEEFGDFELDFEFLVTPGANSGVMIRVTDDGEETYHSGPEFQVLDDVAHGLAADAPHAVGALYALAAPKPSKVRRLPGAWNRGRIRVEGWAITHFLNGFVVCALDLASEEGRRRIAESKFAEWPVFAKARRGAIVLQDHGNEVRYRSVKVREIDAAATDDSPR
ncbi:MAG: family 16 glycoside hydrolase [Planctomycetota bacterium JB042]